MGRQRTAIVWFRQDLRLADNPALQTACERFEQIIPLYIHAPDEAAPWQPGAASRWWLHESLQKLHVALAEKGSRLVVARGNSLEILRSLVDKHDVAAVFWNRLYEPSLIERDRHIKQALRTFGLECRSFGAALLNEPHTINTQAGQPFRVFSAYWRKASAALSGLSPPLPAPAVIATPATVDSLSIDSLGLLPRLDWYRSFYDYWQAGETAASERLQRLLTEGIADYRQQRDIPANEGTSRLSPHLHFGEISPRQVVSACQQADLSYGVASASLEKFLAELGWREFACYLLYHFPASHSQSLDPRFDDAGWVDIAGHEDLLQAWQQGKTGIPLVDAGMRELWQTGWMHNRVRMVVASLLTKNMGFHWLQGARWFWDTLVDADLAANTLGWQWTAGCGVDAAPYFRIFSAPRQAERFDAQGDYIRRWVPELAALDERQLFVGLKQPLPGIDYPRPVIDLAASRKQALQRWDLIRQTGASRAD